MVVRENVEEDRNIWSNGSTMPKYKERKTNKRYKEKGKGYKESIKKILTHEC